MKAAAILALLLAAAPGAAQDRLAEARAAAFPHGGRVREGERTIVFERSLLVDAPFGPVLVSAGAIEDASHGDQGRIAVHYLSAQDGGFRVVRAFPVATEAGSHGAMSDWSISRRFTALPAVYTEGGGTWQGYTCTVATLTELRPDGPAEIAEIPIHYDNEGVGGPEPVRHVEGRIANIRPGRSFDVIFTGSERFTEHYVWRNGGFVRTTDESRASC